MPKQVLQIKISRAKAPKSKLGKWLYWKVYFRVWKIWRPKFLAWFYGSIAKFIYWIAPKNVKEYWDEEFEDIEFVIKNEQQIEPELQDRN